MRPVLLHRKRPQGQADGQRCFRAAAAPSCAAACCPLAVSVQVRFRRSAGVGAAAPLLRLHTTTTMSLSVRLLPGGTCVGCTASRPMSARQARLAAAFCPSAVVDATVSVLQSPSITATAASTMAACRMLTAVAAARCRGGDVSIVRSVPAF